MSNHDPYCESCGRCTDHVGEHDELLALGLVTYEDGCVWLTYAGYAMKGTPEWKELHERIWAEYSARHIAIT